MSYNDTYVDNIFEHSVKGMFGFAKFAFNTAKVIKSVAGETAAIVDDISGHKLTNVKNVAKAAPVGIYQTWFGKQPNPRERTQQEIDEDEPVITWYNNSDNQVEITPIE